MFNRPDFVVTSPRKFGEPPAYRQRIPDETGYQIWWIGVRPGHAIWGIKKA